jgi:hypothetical protein
VEGKEKPPHYNLQAANKDGLQQFQMESCQPVIRLKDKKKNIISTVPQAR